MSRYIESIRIEKGIAWNMAFHQARFEHTRSRCLGLDEHPQLKDSIELAATHHQGLAKCRILYGERIEQIEIVPYERRPVKSIKLVKTDSIDYPYKAEDRALLSELFAKRGDCDDILIIRNGWVTDSYVANAVFWNGRDWHTPLHPLLQGTMRASLLARGLIKAVPIHAEQLAKYKKIKLINAFHTLEEASELNMAALVY